MDAQLARPLPENDSTRRNDRGYFIVVEGIDGIGKTTVAAEVMTLLHDRGVGFCGRKTIGRTHPFVEREMATLARLLWGGGDGHADHLFPVHYWIHLQSAWYAAFSNIVLAPLLDRGVTAIVDGWFYKLLARQLIRGMDRDYLQAIFAHLPKPDRVFLLRGNVAQIWSRRGDFKRHELGLHAGYGTLSVASFLDYQSRTQDELARLAVEHDWVVIDVPAGETSAETAARIAAHVTELLERAVTRGAAGIGPLRGTHAPAHPREVFRLARESATPR